MGGALLVWLRSRWQGRKSAAQSDDFASPSPVSDATAESSVFESARMLDQQNNLTDGPDTGEPPKIVQKQRVHYESPLKPPNYFRAAPGCSDTQGISIRLDEYDTTAELAEGPVIETLALRARQCSLHVEGNQLDPVPELILSH